MVKNVKSNKIMAGLFEAGNYFLFFFLMYLKTGTGSCCNDLRSVEAANRLLD